MSVYKNRPLKVFLKADVKHAYCTCAQSNNFPLCNGSHKGSDKKPIKFFLEEDKEVFLCQCGKSKQLPYCDGSHANN